jgi:hypothetical protein
MVNTQDKASFSEQVDFGALLQIKRDCFKRPHFKTAS